MRAWDVDETSLLEISRYHGPMGRSANVKRGHGLQDAFSNGVARSQ